MDDENDRSRWLPHDHVIRAAAGTAIIFGGDVTHAGLPVRTGTRHLFVMSFTLQRRTASTAPRPPPVAAPAAEVVPPDTLEAIGDEADCDALDDFADCFL